MSKQATPPPPGDKPKPSAPPPPPAWRNWLWLIMIVVIFGLFYLLPTRSTSTSLSYSQFITDVQAKQVKTAELAATPGGTSSGTLKDGKNYTVVIPVVSQQLVDQLNNEGVQVTGAPSGNGFGTTLLIYLITFGLPIVFFIWLFRRISKGAGAGLQGVMGVGRSRAKVFDQEQPSTTFADVAGDEGAKSEIAEVVDFLKNPDRYARAGAMVPRGVLMVGPPGTGKTLLARAVAGEAHVPFFSVSGSSFVELFVGVGAARVRDLFAEARKRAPAIIFIDEIDAIGQRRSGGAGGYVANDEREQTLNQLLAEMDGFEPSTGIVVLAATNRPEILDPALLRPGRFDRQVTVPLPNVTERAAILAVHCRGKKLAGDVDLNAIARGTPGFSGADLANLVNEAAIFAVRAGRDTVTAADFAQARDRITWAAGGLQRGAARGEARRGGARGRPRPGGRLSEQADPVAKVTILPAGQTLGVTEQLPLVERHMYGEDYLHDTFGVQLGGRGAELVVLGQGSTGAANDLAGATTWPSRWSVSSACPSTPGPFGYPSGAARCSWAARGAEFSSRPFAEATQAAIDAEVSRLLREAEQRAVELLNEHRAQLDSLVSLLLEKETVDGSDVYRLTGQPDRGATSPPVPPITVAPRRCRGRRRRFRPARRRPLRRR